MIPLSPLNFCPLLLDSNFFFSLFKEETIFYLIYSSNVWSTGHAALLLQRWAAFSQTYTRGIQAEKQYLYANKRNWNVRFKLYCSNSALWFSVRFIACLITIEVVFANLISQECCLMSPIYDIFFLGRNLSHQLQEHHTVLWCDAAESVEYSFWGYVLSKGWQNRSWEEFMEINTKCEKAWKEGWIILFHFSKDETEMNFDILLCTFLGPLAVLKKLKIFVLHKSYITGWCEFMSEILRVKYCIYGASHL